MSLSIEFEPTTLLASAPSMSLPFGAEAVGAVVAPCCAIPTEPQLVSTLVPRTAVIAESNSVFFIVSFIYNLYVYTSFQLQKYK